MMPVLSYTKGKGSLLLTHFSLALAYSPGEVREQQGKHLYCDLPKSRIEAIPVSRGNSKIQIIAVANVKTGGSHERNELGLDATRAKHMLNRLKETIRLP